LFEAKYPEHQYKLLSSAMQQIARQKTLELKGGQVGSLKKLPLSPTDEHVVFLRIDPPANTKIGSVFEFDIQERDSEGRKPLGGSRYRVVVNRKAG
jgi:hypothetical protein